MGIDDECCDFQFEWIRRLWEEAVWKMKSEYKVNESFNDIPKDVQYSWRDKFWYFDTAKWTNKIDNRSLPGTFYNSEFCRIFEFNSYEIVDDMMDYIMKTCPKLTKKKRSVLEDFLAKSQMNDLMVDTSKISPDLKISALETSLYTTNERINKLEKLLNERLDELELFDSANFTKHENLIEGLKQQNLDIQEVLNNHKQVLEKLNFKNV